MDWGAWNYKTKKKIFESNELRRVKWIHECAHHLPVPVSSICERINHLVGWSELGSRNRPFCFTIAFAKCPKMAILRHFLNFFFFFLNIWVYLRLIFFFCTVQIKDSCVVYIENRRFFLRLIWYFAHDWLQQKILYLVLMHFNVDLAQKWLREKIFYHRWKNSLNSFSLSTELADLFET